jgi:imidazole glycerol-phosphate synthase subunit HisH
MENLEIIMQKIGILSYGVGNVGSILNMLKRIGFQGIAITDKSQFSQVNRIILPGVGSFDGVKRKLDASGLVSNLEYLVKQENIPILGICVGMQVMFEESEEGNMPGLGWLAGKVIRFSPDQKIKIPHVGWNEITWQNTPENLKSYARFYFTHSYFAEPRDKSICIATCNYGVDFTVAVRLNNIIAVQFHPEKSHKNGMNLLKQFASGELDQ